MEEVIRRVVQGDHPSFKEDGHITGEWWGWGREGRGGDIWAVAVGRGIQGGSWVVVVDG